MAFEGVPWAIGGGAEVPVEAGRLLAHVASAGSDGVSQPGDLKVQPLAVPGGAVRVMKGAALIPSRSANADQQSYVVRNTSEEVVPIEATGSSSGRTDMVVARVEDSSVAGEPWTTPADPKAGPYAFARVLPSVPSTAIANIPAARAYLRSQGFTATPLAGITLPASTGTVTAGMIRDLRRLAIPRQQREMASGTPASGSNITADAAAAQFTNITMRVDVPEWATRATVSARVSGLLLSGTQTGGTLRVAAQGFEFIASPQVIFAIQGNTGTRYSIEAAGNIAGIGQIAPGGDVVFYLLARRTVGPGYLHTDTGSHVQYDIQFYEDTV